MLHGITCSCREAPHVTWHNMGPAEKHLMLHGITCSCREAPHVTWHNMAPAEKHLMLHGITCSCREAPHVTWHNMFLRGSGGSCSTAGNQCFVSSRYLLTTAHFQSRFICFGIGFIQCPGRLIAVVVELSIGREAVRIILLLFRNLGNLFTPRCSASPGRT